VDSAHGRQRDDSMQRHARDVVLLVSAQPVDRRRRQLLAELVILVRIARIASIDARCGLLLPVAWSVRACVCLLATTVSPAKTAEPIEILTHVWTRATTGTYGRHLANTIERSVSGSDTSCFYHKKVTCYPEKGVHSLTAVSMDTARCSSLFLSITFQLTLMVYYSTLAQP